MVQRIFNLLRRALANTDENWRVQTLFFFALTLLTRLPFRSHLLYDHDSVQFALGLRDYDVYLHQPHPPGYFLYVHTAKLIDYFLHDANASLIWISVIASALGVAVIYNLGSALFGRRDGWWAALIALTSPLFWFFGEVALTYAVASFLSAAVAIGAWRVLDGDDRWIYPVSALLGFSAGFRQDLALFLGPLWLLAVARRDLRIFISASLVLLLAVSLWFIPMVGATGGAARYFAATSELWQFNNDSAAIWNAAPATRLDTLLTLAGVLSYGVGLGAIFLSFPAYVLVRKRDWRALPIEKILFFVAWQAPALLFFTIVFIPPYKYSYGLVLLPAFFLLTPAAVRRACALLEDLGTRTTRGLRRAPVVILVLVVLSNGAAFCLSEIGFSVTGLRTHERLLTMILSGIKDNFPSEGTLILGRQRSTFSGYRHVQYYLPEYTVYLADQQTNLRGQKWHAFGARGGKTILTAQVEVPPGTRRIIFLADPYFPESNKDLHNMNLHSVRLSSDYAIFFKNIDPSTPLLTKIH
jgi:dolichyl-phosphate-mannose-protein mannosyltransferase